MTNTIYTTETRNALEATRNPHDLITGWYAEEEADRADMLPTYRAQIDIWLKTIDSAASTVRGNLDTARKRHNYSDEQEAQEEFYALMNRRAQIEQVRDEFTANTTPHEEQTVTTDDTATIETATGETTQESPEVEFFASLNRAELKAALATVTKLSPKRSPLPVTSCVRIDATESSLYLTCTNLDTALRIRVPAYPVEHEWSALVDASTLRDTVSSLEDGNVQLRYVPSETQDGGYLKITSGNTSSLLRSTFNVEDFPLMPTEPRNVDGVSVWAKDLKALLEQTVSSAAQDDTRPVLEGVLTSVEDGSLQMTATNGFRLAHAELPVTEGDTLGRSAIVPKAALSILQKSIGRNDGRVFTLSLTMAEDNTPRIMHIVSRDMHMVIRLIDGQYPNWRQITPSKYRISAQVEPRALASAIKSVMAGIPKKEVREVPVVLHLNGACAVSVDSTEYGKRETIVPASTSGEEMTVQFNSAYLSDILTTLESAADMETVTLRCSGEHSVTIIDTEDAFTARTVPHGPFHILMPMYVASRR